MVIILEHTYLMQHKLYAIYICSKKLKNKIKELVTIINYIFKISNLPPKILNIEISVTWILTLNFPEGIDY